MGDNHIAIPALLKIGPGALGELGTYLKDLRLEKVVILFGAGESRLAWKENGSRSACGR